MNAFNTVDLAAACLMITVEYARELGIPKEKWIYPLGGAGTKDCQDCEQIYTSRDALTIADYVS